MRFGQLYALAANSMLRPPTRCSRGQLYALAANSTRFALTSPGHFQARVPWRLVVQITHHARASRPPAGARKEARRRRRTNENDTTAQRAQRARPWALTESPRTARTPRTPRVARPYARAMPRSSPRVRRRREAELPASPRGSRREERRAIRREEKKEAIHPHPPTLLGCGGESRQTTRPLRARARVSRASPIAMRARVGSLRAQR